MSNLSYEVKNIEFTESTFKILKLLVRYNVPMNWKFILDQSGLSHSCFSKHIDMLVKCGLIKFYGKIRHKIIEWNKNRKSDLIRNYYKTFYSENNVPFLSNCCLKILKYILVRNETIIYSDILRHSPASSLAVTTNLKVLLEHGLINSYRNKRNRFFNIIKSGKIDILNDYINTFGIKDYIIEVY